MGLTDYYPDAEKPSFCYALYLRWIKIQFKEYLTIAMWYSLSIAQLANRHMLKGPYTVELLLPCSAVY
jgi:hypothetical protein